MADRLMHIGTRSPRHGAVETLCGRLMHGAAGVWFPRLAGYTKCPSCQAAHEKGPRP